MATVARPDQNPSKESDMEELIDKVLVCRQCGKEFTFAIGEQEYYAQKGWSQPGRCPRCRSDRRRIEVNLVCSACGSKLGKEDTVYCSTCADNLKLEAELKLHGQQEKMEELEMKLKSLDELEESLASATAELEKSQQTNKELRDRVGALEREKSKLADEVASWHSLEASVQQLREYFEAFQQSYVYDIDKLAGLLLEVQGTLTQRRNVSLLHRIRVALMGKADKPNRDADERGNPHV